MLTEYQALCDAKFYAELAATKLEQCPGGSYYADEAYDYLGRALGALESGLRYCGVVDDVNVSVSP